VRSSNPILLSSYFPNHAWLGKTSTGGSYFLCSAPILAFLGEKINAEWGSGLAFAWTNSATAVQNEKS
jgi:hypothetical protein